MKTKIGLFFSPLLLLFLLSYGKLSAEDFFRDLPVKVEFLKLPVDAIAGRFALKGNRVYSENAVGMLQPTNWTIDLPPSASDSGSKGIRILGAPAVVIGKTRIDVTPLLTKHAGSVRAAVAINGSVIFVQEQRSPASSGVSRIMTRFVIVRQEGKAIDALASFGLQENIFNEYLDEIWPLDERTLAIVLRSSRNPGVNALLLFDLNREVIVGMREFSRLQYLPQSKSFWLVASVANCENFDEVFAVAKKNAVTLPVYTENAISEEFKPVAGLEQSRLR